MKMKTYSVEYYLKLPEVKQHCIDVLKRYWRISKNKHKFDEVNKIMKRIMNNALLPIWQDKFNISIEDKNNG